MGISQREVKTGDALKITGISKKQLYYWELKGIIKSRNVISGNREFKRFSLKDIQLINKIKSLLEDGYTLKAAIKKI